ncbi:MAG: YggT family protein [Nitriliruptoraceae bacterium]
MTGGLLCFVLQIYWFVLLLHVVFSWIPRPPEPLQPFVRGVRRLVEPLAAPLRKVIPPLRLGGVALDLSILVLFFGVILLQQFVCVRGL